MRYNTDVIIAKALIYQQMRLRYGKYAKKKKKEVVHVYIRKLCNQTTRKQYLCDTGITQNRQLSAWKEGV